MQYKQSKKIIIDKRKLDTLIRLNCPDDRLLSLIKSGSFEPTGDDLIDENLESLTDIKIFENWGGSRKGSGRPKNNQLENQDENQLENQDTNQVVDKDIDIDNNKDILNKEVIKSFSARWNNNAQDYSNMTEIKVMSDARVKSLKERLKDLVSFCDADDIDPIDLFFEKVGEAYMESDFLQGKKGGFNFTIDFVLQKSSFIKLLEGSYKSGDKK